MAFTAQDVTKVARLARIAVAEDDKAALAAELGGILHWVEQLAKVDTASSQAVASVVEHSLPRREDKVTDGGKPEEIVQNAPVSEYGCFVVPKVIGE